MNAAPGRGLSIAALIVAGESVFLLPFVLARVFRPTLLDVFGLTNLELGTAYSVYGIVAMAAYFFGGPLADKFRARTMLAVALTSTAAGGLVMMTVPPPVDAGDSVRVLGNYYDCPVLGAIDSRHT